MAKALKASRRRRHASVVGARAEFSSAVHSAQSMLNAAVGDLERATKGIQETEKLAARLAEHIGVLRNAVSAASTAKIVPGAEALDAGTGRLDALRTRIALSERALDEAHAQAMRFRRLRELVDGLRTLVASRAGRARHALPSRDMLDRNAAKSREDVDALVVLLASLGGLIEERARSLAHLRLAVQSTDAAMAELGPNDHQSQTRDAMHACESAGMQLRDAATDIERVEEAARVLAAQAERYQHDIRLVGSIMSAKPRPDEAIEDAFRKFGELLEEYLEEARQDNYPAEADAFADLMVVRRKISRVRFAPRLAGKNIVAVAGGFSSGKSSFINSLMGAESDLLPTHITPTTSIPTYLHHAASSPLEIAAFNDKGGRHPLDELELHAVTHDFEKRYGISLKQIVDRIVVTSPDLQWDRIAFVDTPGYTNPEDEADQRRDEELALEEVLSAHYLVWVVDCAQGTLPESDLAYIERFLRRRTRSASQEVYIVISKAEKKPSVERTSILQHIADIAKNAGIPWAGIGMHSAFECAWFEIAGEPMDSFMKKINQCVPDLGFTADVRHVLDQYVDFHRCGAKRCTSEVGLLKRLDLASEEDGAASRLSRDLGAALEAAENEIEQHDMYAERFSSLRRRFDESLEALQELATVEIE